MAVIDFKCKECGNEFFEVIKFEEKVKCPKCNSEDVERIYKGKFYGKNNCGGNCSHCQGCH
ncbi:FmdB family zinc ribbon protein [Haloimpatiens sp. FM7330]|uniref:FmdB family zinc ribbon protein n=1 Tax=Haloimpatiens sp. FM7330 TaxID=3298610 RepID=UPI00362B8AE5